MKNLFYFLAAGAFCFLSLSGAGSSTASHPIEASLRAFLAQTLPGEQLRVMYSDLHPLWGGLRITVRGDGHVEQTARQMDVPPVSDIAPEDVKEIVRLLLDIRAWEQQQEERPAVPDESRAYLAITAGKEHSEIWEYFNDMEKNERIVRVHQLLKERAWKEGKPDDKAMKDSAN